MHSKIILSFTVVTLTALRLTNAESPCSNPNQRNGVCISIHDCPTLITVLQKKPLSDDDRKFLQESYCEGGEGRKPHVCCNEDTGYIRNSQEKFGSSSVTIFPSYGVANILPNAPRCGKASMTCNCVTLSTNNGNYTEIDEFPWMALLQYKQKNGTLILNCGGSLINQRYVVTAASCVTGTILNEVGELDLIRLGEYDISQQIDCVDNDCNNDGILEVQIEEVRVHEEFVDGDASHHNDIALIRLARDVQFSDFIAPICLPHVLALKPAQAGTELTVAGWGSALYSRQSQVKQKLKILVRDQNQCEEQYASRNVSVLADQLCAGGTYEGDSCVGNIGDPLMKRNKIAWVLEGIVSFGNRCGLENSPTIYTHVHNYEDWIKNNMRP